MRSGKKYLAWMGNQYGALTVERRKYVLICTFIEIRLVLIECLMNHGAIYVKFMPEYLINQGAIYVKFMPEYFDMYM